MATCRLKLSVELHVAPGKGHACPETTCPAHCTINCQLLAKILPSIVYWRAIEPAGATRRSWVGYGPATDPGLEDGVIGEATSAIHAIGQGDRGRDASQMFAKSLVRLVAVVSLKVRVTTCEECPVRSRFSGAVVPIV